MKLRCIETRSNKKITFGDIAETTNDLNSKID